MSCGGVGCVKYNVGENDFMRYLVDENEQFPPELPESAKKELADYYSTIFSTKLPNDYLLRWYYISLSVIGLFLVYRMLMTGRS
jgi:hypothetical protein